MNANNEYIRLNAVVSGRVQGVGFRESVRYQAQKMALKGWVRNNFNGSVQVLAEGPRADLEDFLMYLWQGPIVARVSDVQADWQPASGEFDEFSVRYF